MLLSEITYVYATINSGIGTGSSLIISWLAWWGCRTLKSTVVEQRALEPAANCQNVVFVQEMLSQFDVVCIIVVVIFIEAVWLQNRHHIRDARLCAVCNIELVRSSFILE